MGITADTRGCAIGNVAESSVPSARPIESRYRNNSSSGRPISVELERGLRRRRLQLEEEEETEGQASTMTSMLR